MAAYYGPKYDPTQNPGNQYFQRRAEQDAAEQAARIAAVKASQASIHARNQALADAARARSMALGDAANARQQTTLANQAAMANALLFQRQTAKQNATLYSRYGNTGGGATGGSGSSSLGGSAGGLASLNKPAYADPFPGLAAPTLPEFNEGEITSEAQKLAAPNIRRARRGLRSLIGQVGRTYDSPGSARLAARGGFEGFSQGLSDTQSQAYQTARGNLASKYNTAILPAYRAEMEEYLKKLGANTQAKAAYEARYV